MEHNEIAFINSTLNLTITKDRDKAVERFIKNNPEFNVYTRYCRDEEGLAVGEFEAIKNGCERITAVIVSSDILAKDLYEYFEAEELQVGKDISVISLGGTQYADKLSPKLTRGVQNYATIAKEGINLLINKLRDSLTSNHLLIESEIIWGESVAKL